MDSIKLFCLPHAGGMASSYFPLKKFATDMLDIVPVDLNGRGVEFGLPLRTHFDEAVGDITAHIKRSMCKSPRQPYAILGHSMGSWLAYEVYYRLQEEKSLPEPLHMFFSGAVGPYNLNCEKSIHELPDDKFIDKVLEQGGTTEAMFTNRELRDIFLPVLRADYTMFETYEFPQHEKKVECASTLFGGQADYRTAMQAETWKPYLTACTSYTFEGGHFFIYKQPEKIVHAILNELELDLIRC